MESLSMQQFDLPFCSMHRNSIEIHSLVIVWLTLTLTNSRPLLFVRLFCFYDHSPLNFSLCCNLCCRVCFFLSSCCCSLRCVCLVGNSFIILQQRMQCYCSFSFFLAKFWYQFIVAYIINCTWTKHILPVHRLEAFDRIWEQLNYAPKIK